MRTPRLLVLLLVMLLPFAALSCGGDETPPPDETPEATQVTQEWPVLSVFTPTVQFRDQEQQPLSVVDPGRTVDVKPGGNVVVGETGHAMIEWQGFLTNELLSGADTLISLSLPEKREVMLDQAKGTARYVLQGAGEPANVRIKAAWAEVYVDRGTADVIVSLVPGSEPAVWVTSLEGSAQVTRGADTVTVGPSQVVALGESGELKKAVDVDRAAIIALYNRLASGRADLGMSDVAFRCTVSDGSVAMYLSPDDAAETVGDPLGAGDVVVVEGRDANTNWLFVRPVIGGSEGWISIKSLECVGPAGQTRLMVVEAVPTPTPVPPTRAPVRVIQVTATPVLGPATPTPTVTAAYKIEFWAKDNSVAEGTCTELLWETENIKEVYLDGEGVPGVGSKRDCPDEDTVYTLRVVLVDGSVQERSVEVEVRKEEKPTDQPEPTLPPDPTEEPLPTEPPTQEPPTQEPPTQEPPTEEPSPEPTP